MTREGESLSMAEVKPPRRIAFLGFYGRGNFGDDLFGFLLQSICATRPGLVPLVVGASAQREIATSFHVGPLRAWWNRPGLRGGLARCLTYAAAVMRADVVVFGGGTLFGAHASVRFARLVVRLCGYLRRNVAAVGVSVGPFRDDASRDAFAVVLNRLERLAVRDNDSVATVGRLCGRDVPNLGDLALALPAIYRPAQSPSRLRVIVVSIHLPEYIDAVLGVLARIEAMDLADVVLFASLDDQSAAVTGDLARIFTPTRLVVRRVNHGQSLTETIDALASATCVMTSKLHGAICSFVYDVPALLFCYQQKCVEFLDDNGLPGPRETLPDVEDCVAAVTAMLSGPKPETAQFDRAATALDAFAAFLAEASQPSR